MPYKFRKWEIPKRMERPLERYINEGRPVGDFLQAVICHDLFLAVGRADDDNVENLPAFCAFFHNHAPSDCHGSLEKYKAWVKRVDDARKQKEADLQEVDKALEEEPC